MLPTNPVPIIILGILQIFCGIAIAIIELIGNIYGITLTSFIGWAMAVLYTTTGGLALSAASGFRTSTTRQSRCLTVSTITFSVMSFVSALAFALWCAVLLAGFNGLGDLYISVKNLRNAGFLGEIIAYYGPPVDAALLAFFLLMFIVSIIMTAVAGTALWRLNVKRTTVVTQAVPAGFLYTDPYGQKTGIYPFVSQQSQPYGQLKV